jgi:hypothetical protein
MTFNAPRTGFFRLSLIADCEMVELIPPTLARHLGISREEAARRLLQIPSVLADHIPADLAHRLAALLSTFGAQVRLEAVGNGRTPKPSSAARVDLSIQPLEAARLTNAAKALSLLLPTTFLPQQDRCPKQIEAALAGPGGLILKGLTPVDLTRTRCQLRRVEGLLAAKSNPFTALYDLLPDARKMLGFKLDLPVAFLADLKRLGLGPCKLTGAVAARLGDRTRRMLLARYPNLGLLALNQDFQRFDLFLTGARNVSPRELADFLISRSDLPRDTVERMPRHLKIETGLTRANALAFQSDYAALGLETCARLRVYHPLPVPSKDSVGP